MYHCYSTIVCCLLLTIIVCFSNQIPRVHGIEFTFKKLKKKMDLDFGKINYTGNGTKKKLQIVDRY